MFTQGPKDGKDTGNRHASGISTTATSPGIWLKEDQYPALSPNLFPEGREARPMEQDNRPALTSRSRTAP